METRQYRISRARRGPFHRWRLQVTYGLLDVETLGFFALQRDARAEAKAHAERMGWKSIILT